MHIGILKIKNKTIYIDIEGNKIISYYYKNKKRKEISLKALNYIVKMIFFNQSQEKFLYEENGYQVYQNTETGYKHYYKNNKQDYFKFYLENGENALLNKDISTSLIKKLSNLKQIVKSPKFIKFGQALLIGSSLYFGTLEITEQTSKLEIENEVSEILKDLEDFFNQENTPSEKIDYATIKEYINASEKLTEERKMLLTNRDLINDISNTLMTEDRRVDLEKSLKNISIVPFTNSDKEENKKREKNDKSPRSGYYNSLYPNEIHVVDLTDIDIICHEYIHLLQDNNEYYYLRESCAEIIASEYFDYKPSSYLSESVRTRVLMEIIGTDPIWELNFSGSTETFENILYTYLPYDDYKELKELFMTSPSDYNSLEISKINKKIDKHLSTLYKNIYNEPMDNNEIINYLYNTSTTDYTNSNKPKPRYYFENKEKENNITAEITKEIPASEALQQGIITCYKTTEAEITKEEYAQNLTSGENVYCTLIPARDEITIDIKFSSETSTSYYLVNNSIIIETDQELINQGYAIPDKYFQITKQEITTSEELIKANKEEDVGKCYISYESNGDYKIGDVFNMEKDNKEIMVIETTQQVTWEPVIANIPEKITQKK